VGFWEFEDGSLGGWKKVWGFWDGGWGCFVGVFVNIFR